MPICCKVIGLGCLYQLCSKVNVYVHGPKHRISRKTITFSRLVQAQYWHDPLDEETYTKYSQFIARINCEGGICPAEYETNLKKLNKMVLIKFNQDTMVVPRESSHFGYYTPGQQTEISNMTDLPVFTEDRIGLKDMLENDQIVFLSTDGDHLQFTEEFFEDQIVPYLN